MRLFCRQTVTRCKELDASIIVGDAIGVDAEVVCECIKQAVPFTCYGITSKPRNGCPLRFYVQVPCCRNYLERDDYMVRQLGPDGICMALWNGTSRGTIYTYEGAEKAGAKAYLKNFGPQLGDGRS